MTAIPRYVSTAPEAAARIAGFIFGDGNPDHIDNPLGSVLAFTALNTTAWTQSECIRCAGILGWVNGVDYRIATNGNFICRRDSMYAALGITDPAHDLYHRALNPTATYTPTRVVVEAFMASLVETEGSFSTNPPKWFDDARGGTYDQRVDALVLTMNTQSLGAYRSGVAVKTTVTAADSFPMPLISAARYPGDTPADWPDGAAPPPDTTPPAVPTGLTLTPGNSQIVVTWTVNTEPDLAGYILYRDGNTEVFIGPTPAFLDTGLTNGQEYSYQVAAFDDEGNASVLSSPQFATPVAPAPGPDVIPPDAPAGLSGSPTSSTVSLSWNASAAADVVSYRVYQAATLIATVTAPTTHYVAAGLQPSTVYSFRVTAVDSAGNESTSTGFISVTTLFGSVAPPEITTERIQIVSTIGCPGVYDVYVLDRAGLIQLRSLSFTGLSWERVTDEVSQASVKMDLMNNPSCCQEIEGLVRYGYEIGVYRDSTLVWQGPVIDIVFDGENIEVRAEDKMSWLKVRPIWDRLDYPDPGEEAAIVFNQVITNAMSRDNVPGLVANATATGIRAIRTFEPNPPQIAFDAIQELARTSVDYTMVKGSMTAGSFIVPASPIAYITDAALAELPHAEYLGSNFATQWFVTGDPEQNLLGTYGGIDPDVGLVVRIAQEDDIKDQTSLEQNAKSRYELTSGLLVANVDLVLDPSAPIPIELICPGQTWDLRLTDTCIPLLGRFRLKSIRFDVSASDGLEEKVTASLQPVGTELVE